MKRLSAVRIWVIVALLAVPSLSCTLCRLPGLEGLLGTTKHFESDEFSFDYPGTWRPISEF